MNDRNAGASLIAHNKPLILAALKASGITSATISYSGEGDSGGVYEHAFTPDTSPNEVTMRVIQGTFIDKKWTYASVDKVMEMTEALETLLDDALEYHDHSGYENGDGGGGELTIDVSVGTFTLAHYDNYIERDEFTHDV